MDAYDMISISTTVDPQKMAMSGQPIPRESHLTSLSHVDLPSFSGYSPSTQPLLKGPSESNTTLRQAQIPNMYTKAQPLQRKNVSSQGNRALNLLDFEGYQNI